MSCEDFITLCLMPFLSFSSSWKAHLYMPPTPPPNPQPRPPQGLYVTSGILKANVSFKNLWLWNQVIHRYTWDLVLLKHALLLHSIWIFFFFFSLWEKHKSPNCWYPPDGLALCGSLWFQISQHANWFFDTMPLSLFQPPPLSFSILHTFVALWIYSPVIINRF